MAKSSFFSGTGVSTTNTNAIENSVESAAASATAAEASATSASAADAPGNAAASATSAASSATSAARDRIICSAKAVAAAIQADNAAASATASQVQAVASVPLSGGNMTGNLGMAVNAKIILGSVLSIYHDGQDSRISENGTGDLLIQGTNLTLADATTGENFLTAISNGAVKLFYNGSPRLETSASGLTVTGDIGIYNGPSIKSGTNTPEGAVTAPVGSLFLRTNGGSVSTLYVKESGTGNTGWSAV